MTPVIDLAPPSLRDELDRKVMETLEWLVRGREYGKLNADEYSTGLDALFKAVSGLVDEDFIHLITEAQRLCDGHAVIMKRSFHAPVGNEILTFVWSPGDDHIRFIKRLGVMKLAERIKDYLSVQEARDAFERMGEALEKKGWVEL